MALNAMWLLTLCVLVARFQGVALPSDLKLNHFAYGLLEDRARQPVSILGAQLTQYCRYRSLLPETLAASTLLRN